MEVLRMYDTLIIQSYKGPYSVNFVNNAFETLCNNLPSKANFIIDKRVFDLYEKPLKTLFNTGSVLIIEATENNKSLDKFSDYVSQLVQMGIRKDHTLIAIGGGIIQDITAFLATVLLRGIQWHFYPTTLLSQADSCIGSKSSINVGETKNILGTFYPPQKILIDVEVLRTLSEVDICSGIGEIIKVHIIDGPDSFKHIARDRNGLLRNFQLLQHYIYQSLLIKKNIIEQDEFDSGVRNVMNYGHSFGHAIESATNFSIPHGIAVTIGMDMANYFSLHAGRIDKSSYDFMHQVLLSNYQGFEKQKISFDSFIKAIGRDKKNQSTFLRLVLPNRNHRLELVSQENNNNFQTICKQFFIELAAT